MRLTKKTTVEYLAKKLEQKKKEYQEVMNIPPDGSDMLCEYKIDVERGYNEYKDNNQDEYRYVKLGQLEDIEDELGIDILIIAKAVLNGVYVKHPYSIDYESFYIDDWIDYQSGKEGKLICGMDIKDYGKTWALTKEELK